jgi:putative chitinase
MERPDLIVTPEHALKPAVFEWSDKDLNQAADRNDIKAITRAINGGFNGLPERQHWFERVYAIANDESPGTPAWRNAMPDDQTRWL